MRLSPFPEKRPWRGFFTNCLTNPKLVLYGSVIKESPHSTHFPHPPRKIALVVRFFALLANPIPRSLIFTVITTTLFLKPQFQRQETTRPSRNGMVSIFNRLAYSIMRMATSSQQGLILL